MKPCQSGINQSTPKKRGGTQGRKWKDPLARRQKNHLRGLRTRGTFRFADFSPREKDWEVLEIACPSFDFGVIQPRPPPSLPRSGMVA